ncbi:MAG: isoprenylcysteine carboxylmethyltransferase family protein [Gammaproteobacteria bacterium]|nr:isoprenylcysteine carboxylmethyltransferase family protein [Gammaproteobacteria bacterium]
MTKFLFLFYSAIGYLLGLASLAYLAGFLIDFGVPKGINDGNVQPFWISVLIDTSLVLGFGLHHSLTARSSFKRWWTQWIPEPIERATYVYMTAVVTFIVVFFWQPIPVTIWQVENQAGSILVLTVYVAIWLMMSAATFHFGHFGFFGLRQAWDRYLDRSAASVPFTARYLYSLVRHPISLGWMLMPWFAPHMTVGQLVWALTVTCYVLIATKYEEADLVREIGDDYLKYRAEVPTFVPGTRD